MLKQRISVPTTTAKEEKKVKHHQEEQEQEERYNNNNNNKNQNAVLIFFHQLCVLKRVNSNKRDEPSSSTITTTCRRRLLQLPTRFSPVVNFTIIFVIFVLILLRYISSIDNNNNNNNSNNNEPIWTSCSPNNTRLGDNEEKESDNKNKKDILDICFLTSIFGENVKDVDRPANVDWFTHHWCHVRFLLVTNLPDLSAPGWTKINIIQSRHAKFLAWEVLSDIVPNHCAAVVYMDGYLTPVRYMNWRSLVMSILISYTPSFWYYRSKVPPPLKFQNIIRQVQDHPYGLSQVKQKYFDGLPMTTLLRNLVRDRKDTIEHVDTTLQWFQSRSDFQEITPYYLNKYFAYDPNNRKYREVSSYFWDTYTSYGGVWRDQPLWSYVLDHFNVTPAILTTEGTITKGGDLFRTGGRLGWDSHVYVP
ncbi:hypothetical protein FRACYDRAFT_245639 [Fragilariopsis cylindrus CCMP1102]|uniref:Uncharacterized protein n=1 Tax=Fragilariopsis cylindrus CCMP1102 TaxID=635003 RepID=A0A1E7EZS1_9STRA|nr:hypothetical protein FRACYDRAFT_245639 [Fragilariopsis cylindrus CCMP1102]|eukprot:OEU11329.1 hypothetical protein FRACYDRAFT_245639 [Fragilariopsis cylindrus CCMP1102]